MVTCPHYCGLVVKQNIMAGEDGGANPLSLWQLKSKMSERGKVKGSNIPFQVIIPIT
jgi:hypothetical protein